jgi:DNA-directed RNA polymerase specialized sigma24 family protein
MRNQYTSDSLIVEGILAGGLAESKAIEALYNQNKSFFLRLLNEPLRLEQSKLPDDIIWEAIEAFVWNVKDAKYTPQESVPVAAYVRAIAKNLLLKYLSSENARRNRQGIYFEENDEVVADVSVAIVEKEKWDKYLEIFENAGKNCKRILQMVYGLGYSIKDLAEELISEGLFENEQVVRNAKSKCLKKVLPQIQ